VPAPEIEARQIVHRGLPKWPQMLVYGEPVTVDQAKEIIRRTDFFFFIPQHGNDPAYIRRVNRALGIPHEELGQRDPTLWERHEEWREDWGFVSTEYVHNDWISCSFINGPHGWCHPDGTIGFRDNVGKYPSGEDILRDWCLLASEFPFVDLTVVMMDREESEEEERIPVMGFRVADGLVEVFDPKIEPPDYSRELPSFDIEKEFERTPMFSRDREHGIPWSWIKEWRDNHRRRTG
jgi:hypothetical protein